MLANKYAPGMLAGRAFTATVKLDGVRCIAVKKAGTVRFLTRTGHTVDGLLEIENSLLDHPQDSFVLDGELLISDTGSLPSKEQFIATSKIVRGKGTKSGITYHVFDCLSLADFEASRNNTPYSERRKLLESAYAGMNRVKVVPALYSGTDESRVEGILKKIRDDGQEGIMLNLNDEPYSFRRTNALLKVKVMQDCDLKVIGFKEGEGKYKGALGSVIVDYKGNGLGVGAGIDDEARRYIWENREALLGRTITVQYFEETRDDKGRPSLRFPVFMRIREAGKEVSYA
jgi:DNA ligase-1